MVFVLYSETCDLKFTRLSALISPYLVKFMKHNKSNTASLHETVIIFSSNLFIRVH